MNKNIDMIPVVVESGEEFSDLLIAGYVAGQNDFRAQFSGELSHAALQFFVLISEGQFSAPSRFIAAATPQAMERLHANPVIRARFHCKKPVATSCCSEAQWPIIMR